jgi:hypothetical protein
MYTEALYIENQAFAVINIFGQIHGKYQSPFQPIADRDYPSNRSIMGFDGEGSTMPNCARSFR